MRKDHHKLICEKERHGSSRKFHEVRHLKKLAANDDWDWDDVHEDDEIRFRSSSRMSMRHPYRIDDSWKELTDFISPIQGFIRKNVGRVWDEVFSEFCSLYDQRSVLTKHLFQHLKWKVERKMTVIDGKLYSMSRWNGWRPLEDGYEQYYVDPRDGILKENPHFKNWKQIRRETNKAFAEAKYKTTRVLDKLNELQLINGTWFKVVFAYRIPYTVTVQTARTDGTPYSYNTTRYRYEYDPSIKKQYNWERVQRSKTTLSKKQLRDYGIRETKNAA